MMQPTFFKKGLSRIDKSALEDYAKYRQMVTHATREVTLENDAQREARIAKLLKDPKAFQEYYFPYLKETPPYLIKAAKRVIKDPMYFGWWMMFRGARKTTWTTLILPMMLAARGDMRFFVIVAQNEPAAKRLLGNIQAHLESNARYTADFGSQVRIGSWTSNEFTTTTGVSFVGLGMGQSPRGLNIDQKRPDCIVATDLDSKELSKNPARVREMYNWLNEDVLGTFETGSPVARFIFDNNYFSETSLGHIFKTEVEHIHIERVDILDAEGNPAADFISLEYVAKLKQRGYRSFMREYMNTPIEEGSIFKADWIQYGKPPRLRDFEYLLYYNDPSFKSSKASDFKAIVLMGKIGRKYWILRAFCRQCSINNMVDWHYEQAKEMEDKGISCLHYCEANMLQDIVLESYDAKGEATGWYMSILPDTERKPNKLQRIEESSAKWESRDVFIDEKLRDDPDFKVGLAQILAFEKGSRAHDDFPDACEGAMHKLSRKARSFSGTNEDTKPRLGKSNHPKYRY